MRENKEKRMAVDILKAQRQETKKKREQIINRKIDTEKEADHLAIADLL